VVQPGESLYDIAEENGLSVGEIGRLNPDLRDPESIWTGEVINLGYGV
jgi:LysM repeat protein